MRTIKMDPGMLNVIGRAGENLAVQARFRVTEEFSRLYGPGSFVLCLLRPDETEPYAVQTQVDGADLLWNVSATDAEKQGYAQAELRYYAGNTLAKSMRYRCFIEPSVGQPSEEPPEPWQSWVDEVLGAGAAAQEAKAEWQSMTAEAQTLPPGSEATASYAEGVLTIGIPKGEKGEGATSWSELTDKPFDTIGDNLKIVGRALTVDTAPNVQQDNTKPITSAAVYTEVGNINALLALI